MCQKCVFSFQKRPWRIRRLVQHSMGSGENLIVLVRVRHCINSVTLKKSDRNSTTTLLNNLRNRITNQYFNNYCSFANCAKAQLDLDLMVLEDQQLAGPKLLLCRVLFSSTHPSPALLSASRSSVVHVFFRTRSRRPVIGRIKSHFVVNALRLSCVPNLHHLPAVIWSFHTAFRHAQAKFALFLWRPESRCVKFCHHSIC